MSLLKDLEQDAQPTECYEGDPEAEDEPLFDQFDELEDFLTDLAGELGVYETD